MSWPRCVDDAVIPDLSRVGRREGTEAYDCVVAREGERSSSVVSDRLSISDRGLDEMSVMGSPSVAILVGGPRTARLVSETGAQWSESAVSKQSHGGRGTWCMNGGGGGEERGKDSERSEK